MTKIYQFSMRRNGDLNLAEQAQLHNAPERGLTEAEKEAERILIEAKNKAAQIESEARQDAQLNINSQVAKALVDFNRFLSVSESEIAGLVAATVRKIIGVMPENEVCANLVRSALADFRSNRQIVMRVSPTDRSEGAFARLKEQPEFTEILERVVSDPSLDDGQCVIEVRGAKIQLDLDRQLQNLEEALSQVNRIGG